VVRKVSGNGGEGAMGGVGAKKECGEGEEEKEGEGVCHK